MLKKIKNNSEYQGFTLVEIIVATSIIIVIILAFTVFMINIAKKQQTIKSEMEATRILQTELEKTNGIPWKDLMITPASGASTECNLGGSRGYSSQSLNGNPETFLSPEGLTVEITRNVTWLDGTQVTCAGNKDKDELKKVSVTAEWYNGKTTKTADVNTAEDDTLLSKNKTLATYRSLYSE